LLISPTLSSQDIICGSRQKKERIEFPWEEEFGSRSEIRVYIQVKKITI
jgi:hypothetical protein